MIRVQNGYTLAEYSPAEHRYAYRESGSSAAHSWTLSEAKLWGSTLLPTIDTTGTATVSIGGSASDYGKCDYQRTITFYFVGDQNVHTLTAAKPAGYSYYIALLDGVQVIGLGTARDAMYFAIHGFESTTCIRSRCQNGTNYTYNVDYTVLSGKQVELAGTVQSAADRTYTVSGGEI